MTISLERHQARINLLEARANVQDKHMEVMVQSMERMFARITQLEEQVKTLTTQAAPVPEHVWRGQFAEPIHRDNPEFKPSIRPGTYGQYQTGTLNEHDKGTLGATNNTKGMGESK